MSLRLGDTPADANGSSSEAASSDMKKPSKNTGGNV